MALEAVTRIDALFDIERGINGEPAGQRLAVAEEFGIRFAAEMQPKCSRNAAKMKKPSAFRAVNRCRGPRLQAVQTLSRLNRTCPGKDRTYILDFQNTIEDIQTAFKPYYEVTSLEANSDPNQIYELEARSRPSVSSTRAKSTVLQRPSTRVRSTPMTGRASKAWCATLSSALKWRTTRAGRRSFRQLLKSCMRLYSFVAQVIRLGDTGLEKLYTYAVWLYRVVAQPEHSGRHRWS